MFIEQPKTGRLDNAFTTHFLRKLWRYCFVEKKNLAFFWCSRPSRVWKEKAVKCQQVAEQSGRASVAVFSRFRPGIPCHCFRFSLKVVRTRRICFYLRFALFVKRTIAILKIAQQCAYTSVYELAGNVFSSPTRKCRKKQVKSRRLLRESKKKR